MLRREQARSRRPQGRVGRRTALFRPLDVTVRADVLAAFEEFGRSSGGRLDLLFNNAGIDAKGPFASMAWEQAVAIVNVNFVGGLSVIHAGLPLLKATDNALCLSTASASAIFGTATLAVYSATKHAVRGLDGGIVGRVRRLRRSSDGHLARDHRHRNAVSRTKHSSPARACGERFLRRRSQPWSGRRTTGTNFTGRSQPSSQSWTFGSPRILKRFETTSSPAALCDRGHGPRPSSRVET